MPVVKQDTGHWKTVVQVTYHITTCI